ncbi:unnamed protein product [Ilex paraguariensis]|uniref:PGG domain-containing protein n=1 Tax=Ilex paraguariensis TaxID=185542 RepID=A0ABC8SVU2_9AQUA
MAPLIISTITNIEWIDVDFCYCPPDEDMFSRMEKLDLRGSGGLAVSLGAVVAVSGAFIVTLYKGPQILMVSSPSNFAHHHLYSQVSNWVLGGIFLSMTSILTAIWNILMAATVKDFAEKITIVFFFCFFSTIIGSIFTLIAEQNLNAWTLRLDMEMIAIVYAVRNLFFLFRLVSSVVFGLGSKLL